MSFRVSSSSVLGPNIRDIDLLPNPPVVFIRCVMPSSDTKWDLGGIRTYRTCFLLTRARKSISQPYCSIQIFNGPSRKSFQARNSEKYPIHSTKNVIDEPYFKI
eukprot:scaffold31452_cov48-Attheya_sp.AAC.3